MTTRPEGRQQEEEMRKKITAILMDGRPLAVFDNIEGAFRSATLCSVLTANLWTDRVLGRSENVDLKNRTVWIATGNNVKLAGDLPRRAYIVRLDAKQARPWQREPSEFKHPQLLSYVKQNRGRILAAIYVMARAWIKGGRPEPKNVPMLGSFEEWRNTIGGIIEFEGIDGFISNLKELYKKQEMNEGIEGFLEACYETFKGRPVTAKGNTKRDH